MKKIWSLILYIVSVLGPMHQIEALMHHKGMNCSEWREETLPPFTELMLSWNAPRPTEGNYLFYISLLTNEWSPYMLYASWGSSGQSSFQETLSDATISLFQDGIEIKGPHKASGFQIKIVTEGNAPIDQIHGLHVYTNSDLTQLREITAPYSSSLYLPVAGLSQMTVQHVRSKDLCSPTSTTAVVRYLSNQHTFEPAHFASNVWDKGFDIFGNWVFNVAQASVELGPTWNCWVERLKGFENIYSQLYQGTPVVVSIRGPLPGSACAYLKGHLVVVIGYNHDLQKVVCMDPAFPSDDQTVVQYDFLDFIQAWDRRGRVAYIFSKKAPLPN